MRKLSERFLRKRRRLDIKTYHCRSSGTSGCWLNEAWTRSGTRCYQIYSFYFCRWRYEDTLEWCWGLSSARGVSVRTNDDGAWQRRDPKTVREATRGESRRMPLPAATNEASMTTITTFLCQIARSAAMDESNKNIFSTFDAASQPLRLLISKTLN